MKIKLNNIFLYIESTLIERSVPVRLSLLAALSGEHLLLLGPPGTAKSELARKLCHVFTDISYFERLLTRFSVPEELFGPLSIKALEDDRYHRLTKGYLPDASVAFIDEIFKANSAILNSLLTILNERQFDNGNVRIDVPLISVIAASNELPEDEGLDALFDRFLFRYQVEPVTNDGFDALLSISSASEYKQFEKLSASDIKNTQSNSANVKLNTESHELIRNLRGFLSEKSIYISDRRWRKALKILQVCAYTNNKDSIDTWDCVLLTHLMWNHPDQIDDLNNWFIDELKLDIKRQAQRIEKLVLVWESKLDEDKLRYTQKTNSSGEYLYKTPEGKLTTQHERVSLAERDNEVLFLAPPDKNDRTNKGLGYTLKELEELFFDDSLKQSHIEGRWVDVQNYINNTQNRLVNRIDFEALTEPFYFSEDYINNQKTELTDIINNVKHESNGFIIKQNEITLIENEHLWLSGGLIKNTSNEINLMVPKLVDYHQRLQSLLVINESLSKQECKVIDIN